MTDALDKALDAVAKLAPQDNEPGLFPCPFCGTNNPELRTYGPCSDEDDEEDEGRKFFSYRCSNTLCWAESAKCHPANEAAKAWNTRAQSPDLLRERDELREQLSDAQKTVLAYQNHTGQTLDDTLSGKWTNSAPKLQADNARLRRALTKYIEWYGGAHEEDCPQDDTCDCKGKAINDLVNAALAGTVTKE